MAATGTTSLAEKLNEEQYLESKSRLDKQNQEDEAAKKSARFKTIAKWSLLGMLLTFVAYQLIVSAPLIRDLIKDAGAMVKTYGIVWMIVGILSAVVPLLGLIIQKFVNRNVPIASQAKALSDFLRVNGKDSLDGFKEEQMAKTREFMKKVSEAEANSKDGGKVSDETLKEAYEKLQNNEEPADPVVSKPVTPE